MSEAAPTHEAPLPAVIAAAEPALRAHAVAAPGPGRFASALADPDRAFVLEAVHEAYGLHFGAAAGFAGLDPDLRLLGGDALYALGLARLAERGDLEAVAELADLISLCARCQAEDRPERAEQLWAATVARLGDGGGAGARATFRALAHGAQTGVHTANART